MITSATLRPVDTIMVCAPPPVKKRSPGLAE